MTEKDKGTNARLKLEITEVSEPKDIGKERTWMMLEFKAKLEDADKAHTYKAFNEKFFEHIKKGETIDCDINITTNTSERDGEPITFTNRKVTQIYIDGQPVNVRQSGGGRWQDNPETRASIETQTAVKAMIGLYGQNPAEIALPPRARAIIKKALDWCDDHIPAHGEAPKAPQTALEPPQPASKEKADVSDLRNLEIKNLGDLFTACLKYFKLSKSAVLKELGGITQEQIADPKDSWLQIVATRE